jgi:Na+-translocating ferredoxin:NAD+ oxidoreductase subunit C
VTAATPRLLGGIHPEAHKSESGARPLATLPIPPELVVPLSQHKGPPAEAVVSPGQRVAAGEMVGCARHPHAASVHAPTSGVVRAVEPRPVAHPSANESLCVVIETDGEDRAHGGPVPPWRELDQERVRARLQELGVVGLGGAAFPSHRKLPPAGSPIATLVINAAECEPYISCDDALMRARPDEVVRGCETLAEIMGGAEPVVAIEDNKPEAAAALELAARGTRVRIVSIPARYPVGDAHQLIYAVTGIEIPAGRHATECGVQCFNVATAYSAHRALALGEPLVRRIVTVTGHVEQPQNVEALIGTPLGTLLAHAGAKSGPVRHAIGGPLMGFPLSSLAAPVAKSTNCLLTLERPAHGPPVMPCIRCARCADACPVGLQPHDLYYLCRAGRPEKAADYHLSACIECGACDYVCPSHIPLVAQFRAGKGALAERARVREVAERARERHTAHEARQALDRERAESPLDGEDASFAARAVRAAIERARSRDPE